MEQIVTCLSMEQKFTNSKQKILKLYRVHYVKETFQKIGQQITRKKKQGLMDMSMILVLIMILLMLMILKRFTNI